MSYPETRFYQDEKLEIVGLNKEKLTEQRTKVVNCGYQVAKERLSELVKNEDLKNQQSIIKKIIFYWETKSEDIQRAMKIGFLKNTDAITIREKKLKKLNGLSLSKDMIFREGEDVVALKNNEFTQSDFDEKKSAIKEKEKKVKDLSADIELLSKNNKMLNLLSSLSVNKQVLIEYRDDALKENGDVHCPVCGSEIFATLDKELILKEADEYIRQNGEVVKIKEVEKASLETEILELYQKIISSAKIVMEKEKKVLETEIKELKKLKDEIQPWRSYHLINKSVYLYR